VQPISGEGRRYLYVKPNRADLEALARHFENGRMRIQLQETLPLEEVARAHEVLEDGHVRGKIALRVDT
jgi:NADPH:quinone reductase-like Zn-dependent oxidoreductase